MATYTGKLDQIQVTPGTGWEPNAVFGSADVEYDINLDDEGHPGIDRIKLTNVCFRGHDDQEALPTPEARKEWMKIMFSAARYDRPAGELLQAVADDALFADPMEVDR